MRTIHGLKELERAEGSVLGTSEAHVVTQEAVGRFAEATGDRQWIHTDPERAAATPFGGTIVPGYLTLSLAPMLCEQVFSLEGFGFAVAYGLDEVRFPAALPVGAAVRLRVKLEKVEPIPGGAQVCFGFRFEAEGGDEPVCVARSLSRVYAAGRGE